MNYSSIQCSLPVLLFSFLLFVRSINGQTLTDGCLSSIEMLNEQEELIDDYSIVREYILCENTFYEMSELDFYGKAKDVNNIIKLRPNLHIKCGASGVRSNNCILESGDLHIEGTTFHGVTTENTVDNVIIKGLTFSDSSKYMIWIQKSGNVLFEDCEFRDNMYAIVPVLLDYFDASSSSELSVTFHRCSFVDNTFLGNPAYPALIVSNSLQNRIIVTNSYFERNDLTFNNTIADTYSYIIEANGPMELVKNCFMDNTIGVSPVASYGAYFLANLNYGSESSGSKCPFASKFATPDPVDSFTPICTNFGSSTCEAENYDIVTISPSASPSFAPAIETPLSDSPTMFPSMAGTIMTNTTTMSSDFPTSDPISGNNITGTMAPIVNGTTMDNTTTITTTAPQNDTASSTVAPASAPTSAPAKTNGDDGDDDVNDKSVNDNVDFSTSTAAAASSVHLLRTTVILGLLLLCI